MAAVDQRSRETKTLSDSIRPSLCENARAPFSGVDFSHVDAISDDLARRISLLSILRGDLNEFSHSLGQERTYTSST
jgi:hypothetical protein